MERMKEIVEQTFKGGNKTMNMTAEQLEQRKLGIGGSDAGAVLGLNPFATPVDVYLDKIGESDPIEENDAMYWGTALEDTIATEYARRTGHKVARRNKHFEHPDHSFMQANIDRWIVGQNKILECKTAGQYMSDKWGADGTDEVPESYLIQCTHYMLVLGVDVTDLAVLIGGRDFRTYTIGLDKELADMVIEKESNFWFNHVLKRIPPAPTGLSDIELLYPADNGEKMLATQEIENKVLTLQGVKEQIKALEVFKKDYELTIKTAIGDASVLMNGEGDAIVTFKKTKDSVTLDKQLFQKEMPETYKAYSKEKPGHRRFLIK